MSLKEAHNEIIKKVLRRFAPTGWLTSPEYSEAVHGFMAGIEFVTKHDQFHLRAFLLAEYEVFAKN